MNRRELLKKGSIAGLFSLLPAASLLAEVAKPVGQKPRKSLAGYKKIQLGKLELYIIEHKSCSNMYHKCKEHQCKEILYIE